MAINKRFAIVGLGSIGRRHARLLSQRSDISVEIVEPNDDALALARKELGDLPAHRSFDDMLQSRPDLVLVATPHALHAHQTIQALHAGAHVLCEKPMSDNLADGRAMKQAADSTGRTLAIAFQLHFHPGIKMLKETIQNGTLGRILHAHCRVGTYITLVNSLSRYQARQKGALFFDYAHQPDVLYWLLGQKPTAVYAAALKAGDLEFTSDPNVAVINCEYDSGLISSIHLNYVQMPERHEYEIVGDAGWAILDLNSGNLRIATRHDSLVKDHPFSTDRDTIYRDEHQAFLDAVAAKRTPETSPDDGLVSLAICQAALQSCKTRQPVPIAL